MLKVIMHWYWFQILTIRLTLSFPVWTVNVIKDGQIIEKRSLKLPKEIRDVIHCSNPRCISSIERGLPHIFYLADEKTATYRCKYCDEKYEESDSEKYLWSVAMIGKASGICDRDLWLKFLYWSFLKLFILKFWHPLASISSLKWFWGYGGCFF